jgi:uncharacterized protein
MINSMITVNKNNYQGKRVFQYNGVLLEREDNCIKIEAQFQGKAVETPHFTFSPGDRMVEWFYNDRWYNIFEVRDGATDTLKGWYCNITRPAIFTDTSVTADDLALDVFIYPSGEIVVLDEDEFNQLELPPDDHKAAMEAVETVCYAATARLKPFDILPA